MSYPVLDPVSQAYPRAEGRSPTCYSPVRHSCTPERALPFDLHVLSTPPAFVLSQNQTLQTKTHPEKSDQATSQNWQKNNHTPQTGKRRVQQNKKQQTKTTKHTIEFSNNTPRSARATNPRQ